jgi:hypothetical protein
MPAVLLQVDLRNINIFLPIFLDWKLIIGLIIQHITEYHRKNIIPKLKNISLYSIIYSNLFQRYSSKFYPFLLYEYTEGMFFLLMLVAP